jgi:predicted ferric reductase
MNDIDHSFWYITRASGFVAYMLLFAAVIFGLTMTGDVVTRWFARFRVYDLHRFLSLLALTSAVLHALIVLPDRYIGFSVVELLVPLASPYRPFYMALGLLSLCLTAFIVGTFYLRQLVPYRIWRVIHYATFGAFALALVHGVGAGTDTAAGWPPYLYAATGLMAFNLLVYRVLKGSARPGRVIGSIRPNPAHEA